MCELQPCNGSQTFIHANCKLHDDSQLIFVTSAPAALAYFFQAGVQFSTGNARETVLSEVSWDFAKFVDLKYQTDQPKTKYNHPNNKYSPMWNSPVLSQDKFCREFTHFLAYFFQASICAGVRKMTNIRYAWYQYQDIFLWIWNVNVYSIRVLYYNPVIPWFRIPDSLTIVRKNGTLGNWPITSGCSSENFERENGFFLVISATRTLAYFVPTQKSFLFK